MQLCDRYKIPSRPKHVATLPCDTLSALKNASYKVIFRILKLTTFHYALNYDEIFND